MFNVILVLIILPLLIIGTSVVLYYISGKKKPVSTEEKE
jgi:hypothetical protein